MRMFHSKVDEKNTGKKLKLGIDIYKRVWYIIQVA